MQRKDPIPSLFLSALNAIVEMCWSACVPTLDRTNVGKLMENNY